MKRALGLWPITTPNCRCNHNTFALSDADLAWHYRERAKGWKENDGGAHTCIIFKQHHQLEMSNINVIKIRRLRVKNCLPSCQCIVAKLSWWCTTYREKSTFFKKKSCGENELVLIVVDLISCITWHKCTIRLWTTIPRELKNSIW